MSQTVWPLNENGEIVFTAGTGTNNITGYLSQDVLPSTSDGIPVKINNVNAEAVNIVEFGADGAGDDSTAFYDALSWLYGGSNRKLILPQGKTFSVPTPITIGVSGLCRNNHFEGFGSSINLGTNGGFTLQVSGTGLVSNQSVRGVRTVGGINPLVFKSDDENRYIYNLVLDQVDVQNFTGNGISYLGNVFESMISHCSGSADSSNTTGTGLLLKNEGTGIISSVDIYAGTWRGGKYGMWAPTPVNDLRMYGGTYLFAQEEGVRIDSAVGASIFGTHVEGNWQSAANLAAGGAGLRMSGRGEIHGVFGANNSSQKQAYVVQAYADDIVITGGGALGTYTKYGRYQQSIGGNLTLIGDAATSYDVIGEVFPVQVGSMCKTKRQSMTENFMSFSSTVTPNLYRGNFIRVGTLSANITVANPSNRAGVTGEEIVIELSQDATGGRTVTWGSEFGAGMTSIDTVASKTSRWTFVWSGGKWRQKSFSSSY